MHGDIEATAKSLGMVAGGWLNHFVVPASLRYLARFVKRLKRLWLWALRRRSQKDHFKWAEIDRLAARHWPRLEIMHTWPEQRFVVTHIQGRSRMP